MRESARMSRQFTWIGPQRRGERIADWERQREQMLGADGRQRAVGVRATRMPRADDPVIADFVEPASGA